MRGGRVGSLAASPTLVGAVTVLVVVVAVFLSYQANQGLPFVPTYKISAELPNAASLVAGNEVRIGGIRIGRAVSKCRPVCERNTSWGITARVSVSWSREIIRIIEPVSTRLAGR